MQLGALKCALFYALHTVQIHGRDARHRKRIVADHADSIGNRVFPAQAGRIAYECGFFRIEEDTVLRREGRVACANAEGGQIGCTKERGAVHFDQRCGKLEALQLGAALEGHSAYALQLAVGSEGNVGEANVIGKSFPSNGYDRIRNIDMQQIVASRKGRSLNVFELLWQNDLAQTGLTGKGRCTNARDDLAVDLVRNGDVAAVSRVGADLDRAVLQLHVSKGNAVILVDPVCVKRQIRGELVTVPIVFLRTLRVVVPAVEHRIQTLRLGNALQRMITDKDLLKVLQLVRHHVKGDPSLLLQDQGTDVDRAVAVIPIAAQIAKIVAGGIDQLLNFPILGVLVFILRAQQRDRTHCCRASQGRTVLRPVLPVHQRRVSGSRSNEIHVFSIVRVLRKFPGVGAQRTNTDHVFVSGGIEQISRCIVSCRSNTNNITISGKLRGLGEWIVARSTEGHIYHGNVALDGIVQAKHQIGGAQEISLFITLCLNHEQSNLGSNTNDLIAVHGRADHTRNGRAVSLLVLDQRPIVGTVRKEIILNDLVLRCIIGVLTDASGELGMIGINTRIDHRDGHPGTLRGCPNVPQIHIVQIGLKRIGTVRNRVLRTRGKTLSVLLCRVLLQREIADACLIVDGHLREDLQISIVLANVKKRNALGERKRSKGACRGNAKLRAEKLGQLLCRDRSCSGKHDALSIVFPFPLLQCLKHFCPIGIQVNGGRVPSN